jgi:iron-sulfur cluster assembly accessory protein
MIDITQAAAKEIKRLQLSRQQLDSSFRLSVKQGGCSGSMYTLDLESTIRPEDVRGESNGISFAIDPQSYPLVIGLKLDYAEDLMGGGFRFHNPNASSSCGCGHSFAIEQAKNSDIAIV